MLTKRQLLEAFNAAVTLNSGTAAIYYTAADKLFTIKASYHDEYLSIARDLKKLRQKYGVSKRDLAFDRDLPEDYEEEKEELLGEEISEGVGLPPNFDPITIRELEKSDVETSEQQISALVQAGFLVLEDD